MLPAPFAPRHERLRAQVIQWITAQVRPHVDDWERSREFPRDLFRSAGAAGLLGWKYDESVGGCGPDLLADVVVTEELACCGSGGVAAGLGATKDLAPYYVSRFGTDEQRALWLRPCVSGEQVAGLAVTEPGAGSDVAALTTTGTREPDGSWVLEGEKAFCTNGARADWLLVAARTEEVPGAHGLSLFVVPTSAPGLQVARMHTLGWVTSQTGLIRLDGVRVPASHLLGGRGEGFVMIMKSFQWERLALAVAAVRAAAADLEAVVRRRADWAELAVDLAATRALTYEALSSFLAGEEPVAAVSAAKWRACDLAVETGLIRLRDAVERGDEAGARWAERAVRDARLGPIGGGAREVMAELVIRSLGW